MPRGASKSAPSTPAQVAQRQILWAMTGNGQAVDGLDGWDPKAEAWVGALLAVVATGATVVLRPGAGGRSLGVAIWEGDTRHPCEWMYGPDELDEWSRAITARAVAQQAEDAGTRG